MTSDTRFWHPFSAMGRVNGNEFSIVRGEGSRIWDDQGREYLDGTAGLWFCSVGHGRKEIADAAAAQLVTLAAHHCFGDEANPAVLELCERVVARSPLEDGAVFLGSGGSEAVDSAGKIARRYWSLTGQPEKTVIVSRANAYHGMNAYGTSLAGIAANREGFGTLIGDTTQIGWDDPAELEALVRANPGRVAAFIGEPVIGAGGVVPPPDGYWTEIRRICTEHDVLFIQDEVICGFGRLGEWFGCQRYGVVPDMITFAKGVTSGYLPLGGVIASARVKAPFFAADAPVFRHGYTYSGHAAVCAAGLANLDIIEREGLIERVRTLEPLLGELVEPVRALEGIAEVRVAGLLAGFELDADLLARRPSLADEAMLAIRRAGVITRSLRGTAVQLSPPFTTSEDELARMVDGIAAGLREAVGALVA